MGRLLESLRAESAPAANPANPANIPTQPGTDSQIRKIRNKGEAQRPPANLPRFADSQDSQSAPVDTGAIRACLLAHAQTDGIDPAPIRMLSEVDLAAYADVPAHLLPGFLLTIVDTADRHAGRVPAGHTAPMHCAHCGPVWAHPGMAAALPVVGGWPRAAGCPWCAVRNAGGYIPRPAVTCEGCAHCTPDTINPDAGMGTCTHGNGSHYPMARHVCADHFPRNPHES